MLKYLFYQVYTKEIPDEISLGFSITGCPIHCPECHSPHTWDKDLGDELTTDEVIKAIDKQRYITNLLFFGGEWEHEYLGIVINSVKTYFLNDLKVSLYTGHKLNEIQKYDSLYKQLAYLKVGEYNSRLGGLDYPTTNQRLYKMGNGEVIEDITYKFWKTNIR